MNAVRKEIEQENHVAAAWSPAGLARLAQCHDPGCTARLVSEYSDAVTDAHWQGFVEGALVTLLLGVVAVSGLAFAIEVFGR